MPVQQPRDSVAPASVGSCPTCGTDILAGDRFCGGCGSPVPVAAEAELLADLQRVTLGEHDIQGILGRGGMGLVYLAHDISLNKKVAIKVLPPSLLQGEAAVERFRREARIAASLRHRHITSVFALKETTKVVFFVMEYVEGRTLDAILHDEGRLAVDAAEAIIYDTAGALTYAHRREVVHRDLKPANIIVDVEGMAMITDFGVAKVSTAQGLTTAGSTVGSPRYMSPEQWSGKATSLSDQYALGCVAYEMLAGRAPFEGETIEELMKKQLFDAPQPLSELRPDCPPALADAVMRMLLKEPSQRWPSLDAAVAAMGVHAAAPDDPVRLSLAQFAKRGHDVRALPKTPRSPIPVSKIGVRRQPGAKRLPGVRRVLPWVAGFIAVAGAGAYLLLRSPSTGSVAAVEILGAPANMRVGERAQLNARAKNAAGAVVGSASVAWSSSASAVASVSGDGSLTGVAVGNATVTAASGEKRASVAITVQPVATPVGAVASVEVVPARARVGINRRLALRAVAKDAAGNIVGGRVAWASSAATIVAVATNGVVIGVEAGTASVTATSDGVRSTPAVITVVGSAPGPPGILQILIVPTYANVAIDGVGRGQLTRAVDTLSSGTRHRVRFERAGYVTVDSTLTLRPGEQRRLTIQMTPRKP